MSNQDNDLKLRHSYVIRQDSRIFNKLLHFKFTTSRAIIGAVLPYTDVDRDVNSSALTWYSIYYHLEFPKLTQDQRLSAFYWRGVVSFTRRELI